MDKAARLPSKVRTAGMSFRAANAVISTIFVHCQDLSSKTKRCL